MKDQITYIKNKIAETGLEITDRQAEQFFKYYELLAEWNQFMNLTGITEFEEVVQKHFVDSLSIISYLNLEDVDNLIDIGTGAGFSGSSIKNCVPSIKSNSSGFTE